MTWLARLISPQLRVAEKSADGAWRMVMAQTRRIGQLANRLTDERRYFEDQVSFVKGELIRVIGERAEVNAALISANAEIERLKTELDAAHQAHDLDERKAARYRAAWLSCQARTRRQSHQPPLHTGKAQGSV